MTCSRVLSAVLVAFLGYVTLTVAAFIYLPWWQAVIVLVAAQCGLVFLARWWLRRTATRLLAAFSPIQNASPDVLARAEADVHAFRPLAGEHERRVEVELTLFPTGSSAGPAVEWDAAVLTGFARNGDKGMAQLPLGDLRVRADDGWRQPVGPLVGTQRLRFTLTVPSWARTLTLCRRVPGGLARVADLPLTPAALTPGTRP